MAETPDVSKNDVQGFQVQWHGILLTLQTNNHHGISGSLAEMDGGKVRLLNFHGGSPRQLFPAAFHEDMMDAGGPPERPVFKAYKAITDIRLAFVPDQPSHPSPEEEAQHDALLDIQDELWRLLKPEEIKELDERK